MLCLHLLAPMQQLSLNLDQAQSAPMPLKLTQLTTLPTTIEPVNTLQRTTCTLDSRELHPQKEEAMLILSTMRLLAAMLESTESQIHTARLTSPLVILSTRDNERVIILREKYLRMMQYIRIRFQ